MRSWNKLGYVEILHGRILGDTVRGKNMFVEDMRSDKINFTCEPEDKEYLRIWAAKEGRTLSNLVERIVKDAIVQHKQDNQFTKKGKDAV